jgi:uncharacterized protein (TIGR02646 family)
MRLIKKTGAPTSFQTYTRADAASYDEMDKGVKDDLLKSLISEQMGVCAYCQQHLNLNSATIEHHCERSICNGTEGTSDLRLDYKNLMAVCLGKGGQPTETHCDTRKAECAGPNATANGLPMQVNPTKLAHIKTVSYSSTGLIKSSHTTYDKEINELLNLNAKHLKAKRRNKWLSIFRSSNRGKRKIDMKRLEKILLDDLALKEISTSNPTWKVKVFCNDLPGMSEYMKVKFC